MNVFILSAGRSGSTTFIKACEHITNFTAAHESRTQLIGVERFNYPDDHIESDHYLAWFLGKLEEEYGDRAYYVHLKRNPEAVARSWMNKNPYWLGSLSTAYRDGLLMMTSAPLLDVCRDQVETVNANIRHFLKGKTHKMDFSLESANKDWPRFWEWIGAEGDYDAALAEWSVQYNATPPRWKSFFRNARHKAQRAYRALLPR